jgi:hypothetical protein
MNIFEWNFLKLDQEQVIEFTAFLVSKEGTFFTVDLSEMGFEHGAR